MELSKCDVYFTNTFLTIHSKKNVSLVINNEKNLDRVISSLELTKESFQGKQLKASFGSADLAFNQWLESQVNTCTTGLKAKHTQAKKTISKILGSKNNRSKRNIVGEIWSKLSGTQSPTEWEHSKESMKKMQSVIKGEMGEIEEIEHTVEDEIEIVNQIDKDIKFLTNKEFSTHKNLQIFAYYLKAQHKIESICNKGKTIAENLLAETHILKEIKNDAIFQRPSQHLFPIDKVYEKITALTVREQLPIFSKIHEIEQIYSMTASITAINDTIIYSIMEIPLVDFTYKYDFMTFTSLTKRELKVINNMQMISHKSLDLFLCSSAYKTLRVMSSADLAGCQRTSTNSVFICKGRKIKNHDYVNKCDKIPEHIIIELDYNKILLKTNLKNVQMICGKSSKEVTLNSTYSIINVEPECKIIGKEFLVGAITEIDKESEFKMKPFEVTSYNMETDFEFVTENEKTQNNTGNFTKIDFKNLHERLNHLKTMDHKNKKNFKVLEKTIENHTYANWGTLGGFIFLIISGLAIFCMCKNITKCKKLCFE